MAIDQAWLVKGWLLAKDAPPPITEAIEAIIAGLAEPGMKLQPAAEIRGEPVNLDRLFATLPERNSDQEAGSREPAEELAAVVAVKKKRNWSPEARAAAAERLAVARAAKKAKTAPASAPVTSAPDAKPFSPVPYEKLVSDHNEYAGKRDPGQALTDADWPDIKRMLASSTDRRKVASDYDVVIDDLNVFIQSCQRREQRSGNGLPPLHGGA